MILHAIVLVSLIQASETTTPVPVNDPGWIRRHEAMAARAKQGDIDIVFIGDSITHAFGGEPRTGEGFLDRGKDSWDYYYGDRKALNLGISGDRTQNVLWRLDNGELDGIKPKVAVVMIGTNNTPFNSAEQVAEGVEAVCDKIVAKQPKTKVLLLAIFPRDKAASQLRAKVDGANAMLAAWAKSHSVSFLDINSTFMDANKEIPSDLMPDLLHPFGKGYRLWAERMEPTLAKLLGQKPKPALESAPR